MTELWRVCLVGDASQAQHDRTVESVLRRGRPVKLSMTETWLITPCEGLPIIPFESRPVTLARRPRAVEGRTSVLRQAQSDRTVGRQLYIHARCITGCKIFYRNRYTVVEVYVSPGFREVDGKAA